MPTWFIAAAIINKMSGNNRRFICLNFHWSTVVLGETFNSSDILKYLSGDDPFVGNIKQRSINFFKNVSKPLNILEIILKQGPHLVLCISMFCLGKLNKIRNESVVAAVGPLVLSTPEMYGDRITNIINEIRRGRKRKRGSPKAEVGVELKATQKN